MGETAIKTERGRKLISAPHLAEGFVELEEIVAQPAVDEIDWVWMFGAVAPEALFEARYTTQVLAFYLVNYPAEIKEIAATPLRFTNRCPNDRVGRCNLAEIIARAGEHIVSLAVEYGEQSCCRWLSLYLADNDEPVCIR